MAEPRIGTIGDNSAEIDYAGREVERLTADYRELNLNVAELLNEAREIPKVIDDDDVAGNARTIVKRIRDAAKRAAGFHELEKMPSLRTGQGTDQFFFGIIDKLARRQKANQPGASDILLDRLTDFDNRKIAAENERRRLAFEEAERIRLAAEKKAREDAAAAEAARLAAERARKPETQAVKVEAAVEAEQQASAATVEAVVAADRAEVAYVDTLIKPAEITRSRGIDGTLGTTKRENYSEIEDPTKLDAAALWPFIPLAAKQTALNAWAKSTGYTAEMAGARIGTRNKAAVR